MQLQQNIAFHWNAAQRGRQLDVIVDQKVPNQENAWVGRSYADAPDVDAVVWLSGYGVQEGQIARSEVVTSQDYDLVAAVLEDEQ